MTTLDATSPNPSDTQAPPVDNYLTFTRGFLSWALTLVFHPEVILNNPLNTRAG